MSSKKLKGRSAGLGSQEEVGIRSILLEPHVVPPPTPPKRPKMNSTKDKLNPRTPWMWVQDRNEAYSPQLEDFCLRHPISIVSGLGAALELNLGLFSSTVLAAKNPDFPVEEREQFFQSPNENKDKTGWKCSSRRRRDTTIAQYAKYQASCGGNTRRRKMMIKFGTNIDLSDQEKWKEQLNELQKLPDFARVVSPEKNMLSHVGHNILGMNTVQLYMKVAGCRTPGHQENNNLCSININIGPGGCEWFAVPNDYWGDIRDLCEKKKKKNNVRYLSGSWWPDLEEVAAAGIPVYRFMQEPGDLVWVNSGTVHWVQAIGCCNNVSWNVGPFTGRQYQLGMERYEWNKGQKFKSLVPMVLLSWNLARENRIASEELLENIRSTLRSSLNHCSESLAFASSRGVPVRFHGRLPNEPAHYCTECEVEVFNILFSRVKDGQNVVLCMDCSVTESNPSVLGLTCLMEYKRNELKEVYDNFKLHVSPRKFADNRLENTSNGANGVDKKDGGTNNSSDHQPQRIPVPGPMSKPMVIKEPSGILEVPTGVEKPTRMKKRKMIKIKNETNGKKIRWRIEKLGSLSEYNNNVGAGGGGQSQRDRNPDRVKDPQRKDISWTCCIVEGGDSTSTTTAGGKGIVLRISRQPTKSLALVPSQTLASPDSSKGANADVS